MADDNICGKCGTRVDLIADEFGDWRSVVPLIAGKRYHNDCVYDMVANYDRLQAENQRLREELASQPNHEKLKAFWEWSRYEDKLLFERDFAEMIAGKVID